MIGININCKHQDFVNQILDYLKTIETRETNSLKSCVGKRVGLIKTGCGKAKLVGYVDIVGVKIYNTLSEFRLDYNKHLVASGSQYDIKDGGVKYGYILANPQRCEEREIVSKGIVIRKI